MEPEPHPRSPRQGIAMMVVLGVVVFFTMLGFMGLEMATKDSQVSGTLLDIKSKESAAWGGLNLALGVMQSTPSTTVAELQKFIADSSVAPSNKRQWLSFNGGTFSLVASDPRFYDLGTGGDRTGVKVRVVSMDINGTTGINDGSGVPITLECTGQGRNGQQLKIIASYRMLGVDVPVGTTTTATSTGPRFALFLNGTLANANVASEVTGDVYIGGSFTGNAQGPQVVHGKFKVAGSYKSNASLLVDSIAWIGGNIDVGPSAPMTFKSSLGVGGGFAGSIQSVITVDSVMNVYGATGTANWSAGVGMVVGKQLWLKQTPQSIGGPLTVGNAGSYSGKHAYFGNGIHLAGSGVSNILGNLVVYGAGASSVASQVLNVGGNVGFIGTGGLTLAGGRLLVTGDARFDPSISITGTPAAPALQVGRNTELNGITSIVPAAQNALNFQGKTMFKPTAGFQTNTLSGAATLGDTLTIIGTLGMGFGQETNSSDVTQWAFAATAPNKVWKYYQAGDCGAKTGQTGYTAATGVSTNNSQSGKTPFFGGADPRVGGGNTNSAACLTTTPGWWTQPVTNSINAPWYLTDPTGPVRASANDTDASTTANPMDTVYVDATHSPTVNAAMKTLTNAMLNAAGLTCSATSTCQFQGITDPNFFNRLYTYFGTQGWLLGGAGGYMVIRVPTTMSFNLPAGTGFQPFTGKAIWVFDGGNMNSSDAKNTWPASATANAIQVLHVINGSMLQNFGVKNANGTDGEMYGFVYFAATIAGFYTAANSIVGGSTTTGTIKGGVEFAHSGMVNTLTGKLKIVRTQSVFDDISANLPGVLHAGGASGGGVGGGSTTTSTKTLAVRAPTAGIQFVRIGEFR